MYSNDRQNEGDTKGKTHSFLLDLRSSFGEGASRLL